MKIWYVDSTLRDGEQAPGVSFSLEEKVHIASLLDNCGVHEIEAGTPAMGAGEVKVIKTISELGLNARVTSWCRANSLDVQAAIQSGSQGINISFPVSQCQLSSLNKDNRWVFNELEKFVNRAKNEFEFVALGLQDASRAESSFLNEIISLAQYFNVDRIRIADTVGVLNPVSTIELFSELFNQFDDIDFEFHAHNDLGMATANAVAAAMAGAKSISTTINGLGERAGNASLDEVVMALKYTTGIEPEINTKYFGILAEYVEAASGRRLPESKPITGKKVFTHESGVHTNSILKDKTTYQSINDREVGTSYPTNLVFGKHSGSKALSDFYAKKGINLSKHTLHSLLEQVKIRSSIVKDTVPEKDLMEFYYQLS